VLAREQGDKRFISEGGGGVVVRGKGRGGRRDGGPELMRGCHVSGGPAWGNLLLGTPR
jgi:hypothetical protein